VSTSMSMSVLAQLGLIVASIALLLCVMGAVQWAGRRHGWSAELQRKCVHLAIGFYALTLPLTFSERWPVMVLTGLAAVVLLVLRLPHLAKAGIGSTLHGVERTSYGDFLLALSIGFIFCLALDNPVLYVLPVAVLTLSDAAAAMIGTRYGRRVFAVEAGTKSLEGVAMFFMVTWILAMVLLLLMTDIGRINVVLLSLAVAAFGALVEADSWRGFDNLFVPVGIYLFLAKHLQTEPLPLLLLTATFIVTLCAILLLAPALKLTHHAARGYTVLIFLICAVTAPHNAILPVTAVVAHLLARRVRPCLSPYPDLDFLAVVAGIALFWLFVGEFSGHNALNAYNLTFAGATLVFLTLAAAHRLPLAALAALPLCAMAVVIAGWNAEATQWHGAMWPFAAASFALCFAVAAFFPQSLDRYRAPRALALALPVPLALFAINVFAP
jgi:phytol kinase